MKSYILCRRCNNNDNRKNKKKKITKNYNKYSYNISCILLVIVVVFIFVRVFFAYCTLTSSARFCFLMSCNHLLAALAAPIFFPHTVNLIVHTLTLQKFTTALQV